MRPPIHIAVKDFALPSPRRGSIEAHSGFGAMPEQGVELHLMLQAQRAKELPGYKAEVALQHTFKIAKRSFRVGGRADGIVSGAPPLIEEIKCAFDADRLAARLASEGDHPYVMQVKTYAYIYWKKHDVVPETRLAVVSARTREVQLVPVAFDVAEYEAWLARRLVELVAEEKALERLAKRRKAAGAMLAFPFAAPRPSQLELIGELTTALETKPHVMLQAPTGLGKTLGVLLPTLKEALGRAAPVVYVTPKNSQHSVAEDAVRALRTRGADVRVLTLTAKHRACLKDEPLCDPRHCEFARDHYTKVARDGLVEKVAKLKLASAGAVRKIAQQHEVCPYELAFEAAPRFDVIVGDYNYVISTSSLPGRLDAAKRGDDAAPSVVIDEAHNLPGRACDNESAMLSLRALAELEGDAGPLVATDAASASALRSAMALARSVVTEARPRSAASSARVEKSGNWAAIAAGAAALAAAYLQTLTEIPARDPVLRLVQYLSHFGEAAAREGEQLIPLYERDGGDEKLRIICCDARATLVEAFAPYRRIVAFSATLKPFDYYARLSGLSLEFLHTAEYVSPFPPENRKLLLIPQISTRLRDRGREAVRIADTIARIVAVRPGNYVAFFPSFRFLADTAAHLAAPGFDIVRQVPSMPRGEMDGLRTRLAVPGARTLLLAVTGGGFAEGVDYPGDLLIGALIVGPALPTYDPAREAMRDYYEKHFGSGEDYAYTFPAMAKVIQAAGRVIRSETDRGLIVLLDDRFAERRFSSLMPRDWYRENVRELVSGAILRDVRDFWERGP